MFFNILFLILTGAILQFFRQKNKLKPMGKLKGIIRMRCFDAGGCYMGEYNRWPKDSLVWIRPLRYDLLYQASIVRQEKNFLICDLTHQIGLKDLMDVYKMQSNRIKVHKREIYDILTAPHFHYGTVETRDNFSPPSYPHYIGTSYHVTPLASPIRNLLDNLK